MRSRILVLLAIISLVSALFLLSGCSKKECKVSSDCPPSTKCITNSCSSEGKCISKAKPDCCGNKICESSAGENSCTCVDCGDCSKKGKVKFNTTVGRTNKLVDAKYAQYMCDANKQCIIGVLPESVNQLKPINVVEEKGFFKIDLLSTLNQPFNLDKDAYIVRLTLSDLNPKTVSGGLTITSLQVLNGNYLMGEKVLNKQLTEVSQSITESLSLTSSQVLAEEDIALTLKVDYSYVPIDARNNVLQTKRSSQKVQISATKITMIKP